VSCSKNSNLKDLKAYVGQVNQRPGGAVKPLVKTTLLPTYKILNPRLRDPFSPVVSKAALQNRPDAKRPRQSLERYSLDAMKMVGTVQTGNILWALLQSPAGLNRVKVGQYIGQNSGRIVSITTTTITIEESVPAQVGTWQKRAVKLELS
jgi:type IV pilus assembly protein PilP